MGWLIGRHVGLALVLVAAMAACGSSTTGNGPVYPATGSNGNPPGITATVPVLTLYGWEMKIANQSGQPFNFGTWVLVFYDARSNELGSLYYSTQTIYSNDPAGSSASAPLAMTGCAQLIMPGQEESCAGLFPAGTTAPGGTTRAAVADVAPVYGP